MTSGNIADYLPYAYAMSVVLFVFALPTAASVVVPVWAAWRVLGPDKSIARRILGVWLAAGAMGYVALFAYCVVFGVPTEASSIFNHSLYGALFGAGYGGLGAVLYLRPHRRKRHVA
jgi:hypothetical protein